jgi:DNA-binding beta-propeller fold protein YncE
MIVVILLRQLLMYHRLSVSPMELPVLSSVQPLPIKFSSRLLVSPDDMFVYYASPAPDSTLYQLDSTTMATVWALPLSGEISGDIAMTVNGARVIVADNSGAVTAFTVATAEPETPIAAPAPTTDTISAPTSTLNNSTSPTTPTPCPCRLHRSLCVPRLYQTNFSQQHQLHHQCNHQKVVLAS